MGKWARRWDREEAERQRLEREFAPFREAVEEMDLEFKKKIEKED